jgi:integrase
MAAAQQARWPLSAATYETLIGLLAVTGLRIGEAIRLDRADVSLADGLLTIRNSKFGKSRQVPIHPSTVEKLRSYLRRRSALSPTPGEPSLFVHPAGNRINYEAVQRMFGSLVQRAGLTPRSERCRPTIHGLRHTFAVNTLVRWHRDGDDVQAKLSLLSTWLGHADPKWTYWYYSDSRVIPIPASQRA